MIKKNQAVLKVSTAPSVLSPRMALYATLEESKYYLKKPAPADPIADRGWLLFYSTTPSFHQSQK